MLILIKMFWRLQPLCYYRLIVLLGASVIPLLQIKEVLLAYYYQCCYNQKSAPSAYRSVISTVTHRHT